MKGWSLVFNTKKTVNQQQKWARPACHYSCVVIYYIHFQYNAGHLRNICTAAAASFFPFLSISGSERPSDGLCSEMSTNRNGEAIRYDLGKRNRRWQNDDPVLVCSSAATLVYFSSCYCYLQRRRSDGLSFQVEGCCLSRFLVVELFLNGISSCQNRRRTRKEGWTDRRAVYRQDIRRCKRSSGQ